MLLDENVRSVSYRYSNTPITNLPGKTDAEYLLPFVFHPILRVPKPVEILKMLDCYEYQSCEHPGWEHSEAKVFCNALRHRAIRLLPGYDEAPWEWTDRSIVHQKKEVKKAWYVRCGIRRGLTSSDLFRKCECEKGEAPYLEVEYLPKGIVLSGLAAWPPTDQVRYVPEQDGPSRMFPVLKVGEEYGYDLASAGNFSSNVE